MILDLHVIMEVETRHYSQIKQTEVKRGSIWILPRQLVVVYILYKCIAVIRSSVAVNYLCIAGWKYSGTCIINSSRHWLLRHLCTFKHVYKLLGIIFILFTSSKVEYSNLSGTCNNYIWGTELSLCCEMPIRDTLLNYSSHSSGPRYTGFCAVLLQTVHTQCT